MSLKKIQHIVPRFYLKQFALQTKKDNYKIFCFLKETNKVIRPNIENVAAIKFFYDKYQPQPIENYLSITEKDLSRTYNKIVENRSIESMSKKERFDLTYLTYFQYIRTEYQRTKARQILNYELDQDKSRLIEKYGLEGYKEYRKHILEKYAIKLQKILIVIDNWYANKISKKFNPNILRSLLNLKTRIIRHIHNLNPLLLELYNSNYEFYTSDHPIVFYNDASTINDEGITFLDIFDKRTQIFYPLSPDLCLMFYNNDVFGFDQKYSNKKQLLYKSDFNKILLINNLITNEAFRAIFSRNGQFNTARNYLDKHPEARNVTKRRFLT